MTFSEYSKAAIVGGLLALIVMLLLWGFQAETEPAIAATNRLYLWGDSLAITITAIDTLFPTTWEDVIIWPIGADIYARFGNPDTSSWSSRKWVRLNDGDAMAFAATRDRALRRLEVKAVTGSGALFMAGHKTTAQY